MKTLAKNKWLIIMCCLLLVMATNIIFVPQSVANVAADSPPSESVITQTQTNDHNFSMSMKAIRRSGTTGTSSEVSVGEGGEQITFIQIMWQDLQQLQFNFSATLQDKTQTFTSAKFVVTYLKSDSVQNFVGVNEPDLPLFEIPISYNVFNTREFYYNIDSTSDIAESATQCNGHDFGLYKFDFIYTYLDGEEQVAVSTGSSGGIYVAVLPTRPEDIDDDNVSITYAVRSSNKLMNVFNLKLSNDAYKYINPARLKWNVIGTDGKDNYVLTKQFREANPLDYGAYKFIYESLDSTEGHQFIFDSKDIEGTWTAYCTIHNTDGTSYTIESSQLSTYKTEKKSNWWIILIVILACIAVAFIISFIINKKKKDQVW